MTLARRVIGVLLVLTGGVWFFQGIGVIHGSFMTSQASWVVIGACTAIVGAGAALWPKRGTR